MDIPDSGNRASSIDGASKSFSLLIPILICSVPYLGPDPRWLRACSPRLAITGSDLALTLKLSNALAEQPQ
jgi:hypothetical protein